MEGGSEKTLVSRRGECTYKGMTRELTLQKPGW